MRDMAKRRAESAEKRATRLDNMRAVQDKRIRVESSEDRSVWLEHVRALQHQRLVKETSEERDIRSVVNEEWLNFIKKRTMSPTFIFSLSVF